MTRILIIEDEAKAARELAAMLTAIDEDIEIAAILDSVEQSLQWFDTHDKPDLIFLTFNLLMDFVLIYIIRHKCNVPLFFVRHLMNT